jgi:tetratricopeptide (TPR) repeat protein
MSTGNLDSAAEYAMRAQEYAEAIGNIYAQARSLYFQARYQILSANFSKAEILLKEAMQLLISSDVGGTTLKQQLLSWAAEIHLLRTEYLESRDIQISIAAMCKSGTYDSILANLNIALIDITCGVDSRLIRKSLDQYQLHCGSLYGSPKIALQLETDYRLAELCLRDGDLGTANVIFTSCFAASEKFDIELATVCLERLADLSIGMNNIHTTMGWAGIFLVLALRSKNKLAIMKAFRCLGQIFAVQGDIGTALSLFNVALDGFTFMDVHQWRADCMVRVADIWNSCGEVMRAVGFWKAARPLFERSSQAKDVARIDAKLAKVEASILENYERQFLQLAELNVPAEVLTVTDHEKDRDLTSEEDQELGDAEQNSCQIAV